MKRIFLLSTFVLTQTIFATTLTIYNSNIALVHETHEFKISKQNDTLIYDDIPNTLVNDSLNIELPPSVQLYSQTYKRKNLTQYDLAKKFLGKEITCNNGSHAKILTISGNNVIVENEGGEVFISKISDIVFPYLPKGLQANATLNFNIHATKDLKTNIEISYLAKNISFSNDYILNIDKNRASLQGWVNIINNSDKDFRNTTINLLAGDVHRAYNHAQPVMYKAMVAADQSPVTHKTISGYHKYTLPFKTNLNSYEKKRLKLLEYKNITIQNSYIAVMNNPLYLMGERSSSVKRDITIANLDRELPSGIVRIYTKDEGETLLLGETNIANTPKETPITLQVGQDFDTKVNQKVISRNDTKELLDVNIEYQLTNHSDEDKILTLRIPFNKKVGSKVISKLKYSYTKGNYVTFILKVKANSQRSFEVNFISKRR